MDLWGSMDRTLEAMANLVVKGVQMERGKGLGVIKTTLANDDPFQTASYKGIGMAPVNYGSGLIQKPTGKLSEEDKKILMRFMRKNCDMLKECMPRSVNNVFKNLLKDGNQWSTDDHGFVEMLPSMVIGESAYLVLHEDRDAHLGIVTVHCEDDLLEKDGRKCYSRGTVPGDIVAYFVFPQHGYRVPLRSGDVLIFDAKEKHCISSATLKYLHKRFFCCSNYLKNDIAGLNNSKINFDDGEAVKQEDTSAVLWDRMNHNKDESSFNIDYDDIKNSKQNLVDFLMEGEEIVQL